MIAPDQPPLWDPDEQPAAPRRPRRSPGRYQYGLGSLLLATALFSVLAAALGGMLRAEWGQSPVPTRYFLLMAVATPIGVMILISVGRLGLRLLKRLRQR